ncbi:MAG: hypothetical protein DWQ10_12515 [Calditrichaeota bacterium]|nr:MAG: hypothetical protein DWQ10_12515 [Calditrichota bacterium]
MFRIKIFGFFLLFCTTLQAFAQSTSLPLLSNGKTEFSLTTQAGFSESYANDDRVRLFGAYMRFGIGFHQLFDIYALIGTSKQNIRYSDTSLSDFDSDLARSMGGGIAIKLPYYFPGKIQLATSGQLVLFAPTGTTYSNSTVPNTDYRKRHDFEYEWQHVQLSLFAARKFQQYEFFIGGEYIMDIIDFKHDLTLESEEGNFYLSRSRGNYLQENRPNASVGVNIALPGRHYLGIELKAGMQRDMAIFIAIGQTGKP